MTFGYFEMTAKDPPQDETRGGEVVDEEKFFAEKLKIEVRRTEARALLGDVHAPSGGAVVAREGRGGWGVGGRGSVVAWNWISGGRATLVGDGERGW